VAGVPWIRRGGRGGDQVSFITAWPTMVIVDGDLWVAGRHGRGAARATSVVFRVVPTSDGSFGRTRLVSISSDRFADAKQYVGEEWPSLFRAAAEVWQACSVAKVNVMENLEVYVEPLNGAFEFSNLEPRAKMNPQYKDSTVRTYKEEQGGGDWVKLGSLRPLLPEPPPTGEKDFPGPPPTGEKGFPAGGGTSLAAGAEYDPTEPPPPKKGCFPAPPPTGEKGFPAGGGTSLAAGAEYDPSEPPPPNESGPERGVASSATSSTTSSTTDPVNKLRAIVAGTALESVATHGKATVNGTVIIDSEHVCQFDVVWRELCLGIPTAHTTEQVGSLVQIVLPHLFWAGVTTISQLADIEGALYEMLTDIEEWVNVENMGIECPTEASMLTRLDGMPVPP